jgi:GAF domain-containing protein/HAMP domain-containing protein
MKKLFFRLPETMSPQARSAFLFGTLLATAHIAAVPYYFYLASTTKLIQFFLLGGISFVLGLILAFGSALSWRERPTLGVILALSSMAVAYPIFATMVTGLGLVLGIAMMIVGTMTSLQVLARRSGQIMAGVAILSGVITVVLDAYGSTSRPGLPGIFIQFLVLAVIALLGIFLVREFPRVQSSVSYKLISVVIMVLIVSAGFQVVYSNGANRATLEKESRDTLVGFYKTYESKIETENHATEALALSIANRADVQALYQSQDRDGLYKLLSPLFAEWKEREIVHLYIENPNGTVFLRVHNPTSFDDDITYRATAKTALQEKRPVSGVEIGPSRLGVRGVAPMYSSTGQFIGLTEVGMDFDEKFISDLKDFTGADYTMWVLRDAAAVAKLQPVAGAPAAPLDELFYYASSSSTSLPVNADDYRSVLETGEPVFRLVTQNTKTPSIVYITPLLGYGGKVIGLLQISDSYVGHLADERNAFLTTLAVTALLALLGLLLIALFSSRAIIAPLNELSNFAARQMSGEVGSRVSVISGDEFQQLAETFNLLAGSVEQERSTLEQRVASRTRNLELAADVGRAVSQVRDLDVMLNDACELILKEFGLHYVQVYLTDPSQTNLKLEAGTGMVGAQLLERGHSLPLDSHSINGRAALNKRTVVIADTAQATTFRKNPLLPDTRGEMAVPLIVADKVVGVLDMQSNKPGILTEEVLPAFEALAGQMAVAIQNANLLSEAQHAREEVETQARRLARTAWNEHLDAIHKPEKLGFVFDHKQVTALEDVAEAPLPSHGNSVTAPISVTGEALGTLVVELENESRREQSNELVSLVARQVSQQIENLRLLESAERYRHDAEQAARLQTIEGWQKYMASRSADGLGYLYDTIEVHPHNNGHDEEMFALPLKARDETVGKLGVKGLKDEDQDSVELANAVAERLSAHIENLRLFEETRLGQVELDKRARQLAAVAEISTASSREFDIQKMLESVVHLTQRKFSSYHCHVFLYDEHTNILKIAACGWKEGDIHEGTHGTAAIPLDQEQSLVARAGRTRQAVIVNDVHNEPGWLPNPLLPDTASELAVPLLIGDRLLGVLDVQSDRLNAFTDEDANIQTTLASQVATALQNAYSFNQAQSALAQSEQLFDASRNLTQATDLQQLVRTAVDTLKIPAINRAILVSFNYSGAGSIESLDIIANWWNGTGLQATNVGTHYPLEVIRAMTLFVSPTPVFFNDTFDDARVDAITMQLVQRLNLRAVAVLPLHTSAGQIGALILEAEVPHNFSAEETRLFTAIAPQIATIVDNRRQFERAQKQAEREAMLNVINQKIQSATSVEAVLQIAARELGHALGAPMTIAQLSMKDRSS